MRTLTRTSALLAGAVLMTGGVVGTATALPAASTSVHVLRVGTWHGIKGTYTTIQSAVDAAKPGDWILVGPGDYHERGDYTTHKPTGGRGGAGVWITTPNITLRGMDRNTVVIDGTKPGSPKCSNKAANQDLGPLNSAKQALGRNGVFIDKATNVSVENMTECNFLAGAGNDGNGFWWNGGDDTGKIGGYGKFYGSYLTATSTYFGSESIAAQYGIFSSNWAGGTGASMGVWDHTYASNFNDSGYYIGACRQVCNQEVNHAWAEYNALGYSGSNSGGTLIIENSEFDQNQDGFDTNSQNGDNPPPQNGACPGGAISPITHTTSCWVFIHNYVHDNNNPNVPTAGFAGEGPVGTGISLSGARNDTVMDNRFVHNGAWGIILVPFPDSGPPCTGGTQTSAVCLYDEFGDHVTGNTFTGNGFFGHPTNGDIATTQLVPTDARSCFSGNTDTAGTVTTSPPLLETTQPTCDGTPPPPTAANPQFLGEVACDSQATIGPAGGSAACLPGDNYPRRTSVIMHALPAGLTTMSHPCAGVPTNPWCPASSTGGSSASGRPTTGGLAGTGAAGWIPVLGAVLLALAGGVWFLRRHAH